MTPAEGSQQRQLQAEANGKRKRAPARSRSTSRDEEDLQAGLLPDFSYQQSDSHSCSAWKLQNVLQQQKERLLCRG